MSQSATRPGAAALHIIPGLLSQRSPILRTLSYVSVRKGALLTDTNGLSITVLPIDCPGVWRSSVLFYA